MARRAKEEAEKTRARILANALALFAKKGYERTTFTDIAARLKMTKGAVYWHFASKEALLVALVDEMLEKFERQIDELRPKGELTYPEVAEMMVKNGVRIVQDQHGSSFFRLMKCQIRWTDDSMTKVREKLFNDNTFGPLHAFRTALENDAQAGRIRRDVAIEEVATVSIALWDGLVQARIDDFLSSDLETTLRHAYQAIWKSIQV